MKVRPICWNLKEGDYGRFPHVLSMHPIGRWYQYSVLDALRDRTTREKFEKHYLEWKTQNED